MAELHNRSPSPSSASSSSLSPARSISEDPVELPIPSLHDAEDRDGSRTSHHVEPPIDVATQHDLIKLLDNGKHRDGSPLTNQELTEI